MFPASTLVFTVLWQAKNGTRNMLVNMKVNYRGVGKLDLVIFKAKKIDKPHGTGES